MKKMIKVYFITCFILLIHATSAFYTLEDIAKIQPEDIITPEVHQKIKIINKIFFYVDKHKCI